jgi:hypothetical protein
MISRQMLAILLAFISTVALFPIVHSFTTTNNNLIKKIIATRETCRLRTTKLGYIDDMTDSSSLLDGLLENM